MIFLRNFLLIFGLAIGFSISCTIFPCTGELEKIFCHGEILETAWKFDFQQFLYQKLKFSPIEILKNFEAAKKKSGGEIAGKDEAAKFFSENFEKTQAQEITAPLDWLEHPKSLQAIADLELRQFAAALNNRWRNLTRRLSDDVKFFSNRYSIVYIPYPYVVPGGNFQEYYYWDSYWVILGLLFGEMYDTVRGMIRNFAQLVNQIGYVPNSGRIFEGHRSQPPFFAQMVDAFIESQTSFAESQASSIESQASFAESQAQNLNSFLIEILPNLEKEIEFWESNRSVEIRDGLKLFQYRSEMDCPRPEEFNNDMTDAKNSNFNQSFLFSSIVSACESGQDFSSRWDVSKSKSTARTIRIVPVDLNAFMCKNYVLLEKFYLKLAQKEKAAKFAEKKFAISRAIEKVLWNETLGAWFDYDLDTEKHRTKFFPSNIFPLYSGCFSNFSSNSLDKILFYWEKEKADHFPGGIPASFNHTGQQWDWPNAWSPLVHLVIESFDNSKYPPMVKKAEEIAKKWVKLNYRGFQQSGGKMWEKYDVTSPGGVPGGGGEYPVQEGFGWTNGVVLRLLQKYGDRISLTEEIGSDVHAESIEDSENSHVFDGQTISVTALAIILSCLIGLSCLIAFALKRRQVREWTLAGDDDEAQYRLLPQNFEMSS